MSPNPPNACPPSSATIDTVQCLKFADRFGKIDIHVHCHALKKVELEKISEWMKTNDVQRCMILPLAQTRPGNKQERQQLLRNYAKYKGKIDRYCVIFPDEVASQEEAVKLLTQEKEAGAIGFGEHYGKGLMFDDPKNMRLYAACAEVGLAVLFHMDSGQNKDKPGLPHLENALKTYPYCTFIAHAFWWKHLAEGSCERLLQKYPNLYADVSAGSGARALSRDKKFTRAFMIRNADKLLFGTDSGWWSFGKKPAPQFSLLESLALPDGVKGKIYRENAIKLFKLKSK